MADCYRCKGSGRCPGCDGTGKEVYTHVDSSGKEKKKTTNCGRCGGNGKCVICKGSGKTSA